MRLIRLRTETQEYKIPASTFVAGWISIFCAVQSEPWYTGNLRLYAYSPGQDSFPTVFASVEMLCNILSNASDWRLRNDLTFIDRNSSVIFLDQPGSAKLCDSAIEEWWSTEHGLRSKLADAAEALILPSLVAHGQSQD